MMDDRELSLRAMEEDLAELAGSRVIKTEADRALIVRQQRLVEILIYGGPKTKVPSGHHK
jgi:hypothetical protein